MQLTKPVGILSIIFQFSFEVPTLETINGAPVVISLLDSEDERLRVLETLLTLCKQWIERTLEMAPLAVQSSLYVSPKRPFFLFPLS